MICRLVYAIKSFFPIYSPWFDWLGLGGES